MNSQKRRLTAALMAAAVLLLTSCTPGPSSPGSSADEKAATEAMNEVIKDLRESNVVVYEPEDPWGPWSFEDGYVFLIGGPNEDYAVFGSQAADGYWAYLLTESDEGWQVSTTAPAVQNASPTDQPRRAACLALSDELGKDPASCEAITD